MFADYSRMARVLMFAAVFLAASEINVLAQRMKAQPDASTNQAPKAARTVHMVYDAVEADMYYSEMRIEQSADNSFFVPCGWENGYFGLQQFDGEEKRALNFAVWNPENMDLPEAMKNAPVEVVYANPSVVVTRLKGKGGGVQCMRQMKWRAGETYRLAVQAQVMGKHTAYTAWLYGAASGRWERLATFRALTEGRWLRGYFSFIEDFRRDYKSAQETRRARFENVWVHQYGGGWVSVEQGMFTVSSLRGENKEAVNASGAEGGFVLATGGAVKKEHKVGRMLKLEFPAPIKRPEMPDLWFLHEKPKL